MSRISNPLLRKIKPLKSAKSGFFYGQSFEFSSSQIGVLLWVCSWFLRVSFESASEKYPKLRTNVKLESTLTRMKLQRIALLSKSF